MVPLLDYGWEFTLDAHSQDWFRRAMLLNPQNMLRDHIAQIIQELVQLVSVPLLLDIFKLLHSIQGAYYESSVNTVQMSFNWSFKW